jgi:hypothetical protein
MTPTMADPNRSRHHNDNNNNNDDANDRFFRRLTFDQVYTRSFGLFMERLNLFLTIAVCLYLPYVLVDWLVPAGVEKALPSDWSDDAIDDAVYDWTAFLSAQQLFATLVGIVGHAAIARAVAESYVVRTTTNNSGTTTTTPLPPPDATPWRYLRRGMERNFCTIFCGRVLVDMTSLLAVALFVVIAILNGIVAIVVAVGAVPLYLFVTLAVSTVFVPIVVIENKPAVEGLRRSFALVSKDVCHVLITSWGMTLLLNLIGGGFTVWIRTVLGRGLLATGLAKLPFLIQFPLSSICNVVIYLNLRVIHEDLHRDGLARELSAARDNADDTGDGDYQYHRLEDNDEEAGAIVAEEFGTTTTRDDNPGVASSVDPLLSSHTTEPGRVMSAVEQTAHDGLAREPNMTNSITTLLSDSDGDRDLVEAQAVCIAEEVKVYIP